MGGKPVSGSNYGLEGRNNSTQITNQIQKDINVQKAVINTITGMDLLE